MYDLDIQKKPLTWQEKSGQIGGRGDFNRFLEFRVEN
jgi:hypothetical protein